MEDDDVLRTFAQGIADSARKLFFPCLPRIEVVIGSQAVFDEAVALYRPYEGIIEVSRSRFREASFQRIASSVVHSLVHAYGYLKGFLSKCADASECFLCQAFNHGLDLVRLLERLLGRRFSSKLYPSIEMAYEIEEEERSAEEEPIDLYPPIRVVDEDCLWDAFGPSFYYAGAAL